MTAAVLYRVPSAAHICSTISDKHHNVEPMGESPFFISETSTSHPWVLLSAVKAELQDTLVIAIFEESLCSSLLPFLKLQVPSSLRIGPEVTIKIADVFRKESYREFVSGCQSTFCYTKNFPSIPHFAIKIPSELHEVDGMNDG